MPIVAYLCDRQKCEACSYPTCQHTTDIDHAVNFKRVCGSRWAEQPRKIIRAVRRKEAHNDTHIRRS